MTAGAVRCSAWLGVSGFMGFAVRLEVWMKFDKCANERKKAAGALGTTQVPRLVLAGLDSTAGTIPDTTDAARVANPAKVWLGRPTLLGDKALVKCSRQIAG